MRAARLVFGTSIFAREWALAPRSIGAICPSSSRLASVIADEVIAGEGRVLQLGGGTGVVTRALLDAGVPAHQLTVVERSEGRCQLAECKPAR